MINHTHNQLTWSPSHGQPLSPAGYRDLFETLTVRIFGEAGLFARCRRRADRSICRGVDPAASLERDPALTIVASRHPGVFRPHPLDRAGAARGEFRVNPLYAVDAGRRSAAPAAEFPAADYEDEYGACRQYLPEETTRRPRTPSARARGRRAARRPRRSASAARVIVDLPRRLLLSRALARARTRRVVLRYPSVAITGNDVMQNPFVYGEVVPAAAFVNRVAELDRLVGDLAAGQKIFLISPRRYGKSSLIRHALAAMARRGALTVEVTVSSFSSYVAFLEGYARALAAAETKWDQARTWLRDADPVGAGRSPLRARRRRRSAR